MVMTIAEASKKLRNLIEYYNLARCVEIPGDIPVVEVPIDKYDILALQIAIEALEKSDLINRLANIKSEPITLTGKIRKDLIQILNKRKEGDPDEN